MWRTHGSAFKVSTTIRASPARKRIHALGAPGAFKGADPYVVRVDGEISITTFAVRAYLKHDKL